MKTESVIIFSNYSNEQNSTDLQKALEKYKALFDIQWKKQRISSGLSDATQYFSGILIVGIKRNLVKSTESK
jgi:type IV secretory pathway TrbF-like protein